VLVVSDARDAEGLPDDLVVTADRYVEGGDEFGDASTLVINLCRSFRYGSKGYYVSLLADARGQQVLPSIETSAGLADPYARFRALQEAGIATLDAADMAVRRRTLDAAATDEPPEEEGAPFAAPLVQVAETAYRVARSDEVAEVFVVMGRSADPRFRQAARVIFREWPAPLLRLQFVLEEGEWHVTGIAAASPHELDAEQRARLAETLSDRQRVVRRCREPARETVRASIAVLVDHGDPFSPSSPETIDRLERVAAKANVHIARLNLCDLRKLPEYDALFIRCYTAVTHPAFQFALRAEALDMPVIDDTQSTIRCTNKVFLEELLRREGVATPRTLILTEHTPWSQIETLRLPLVVKLPDGSFSAEVHKIASREDYEARAAAMFRQSPLLIAQEWLPTDFDWRIGVLGGRLLFAARYHMARGHWQIRSVEHGAERYGKVDAMRRDDAPPDIVRTALRAAALIGSGFYGVDIKESPGGPVVIEVNDNPNLDSGYDDAADGDRIYEDIVAFFLDRIEAAGATDRAAPGRGAPERGAAVAAAPAAPAAGSAAPDGQRTRRPGRAHVSTAIVRTYGLFEVVGLELEYPTVDENLEVVPYVEQAFRALAGRGTSSVELGAVGFSNEFADHVFEIKTLEPAHRLADAEAALVEGIQRFGASLHDEFGARLLPTGMHPWFDPMHGRLWTRSGLRIYTTYARLFDVRTHGWMNVHASHINLPFGNEAETMAMHSASALLVPYLPALAASSPVYDGALQNSVDSRLDWLAVLQARVPESCGDIVPEFVGSFSEYRKRILQPMYAALDSLPYASAIRHEFFNARGAVLRFNRRALEVRVVDTQECVRMDVAIAAFVRAVLRDLTGRLLAGRIAVPSHDVLVSDFHACIREGSRAQVRAPHLRDEAGHGEDVAVRDVLRGLLDRARMAARADEADYFALIEGVIENGSLGERIRAALEPHAAAGGAAFRDATRAVYRELIDSLENNEPWAGRSGEAYPLESAAVEVTSAGGIGESSASDTARSSSAS
jgi:glutathione synthase/RimK-type ligase-like ATP-grasp enzyme/gamma-glutamyl:cysteine ligase YbdK (ATP-grasp superfamily)